MKRPHLHSEWKLVIRRAWSFRLTVIAGIFSATETLLPYFSDDLPRGIFSALTIVASVGAMVASLISQQGFSNADHS